MADIDLKTETPDTSLPATGFLFGADSQASASPSVYSTQAVATTLLGSTTLSGTTITANAPVVDFAQTWNNAAVTFTGMRFNAAGTSDANSASASLLMDLQVGGASRLRVNKEGSLISQGGLTLGNNYAFYLQGAGSAIYLYAGSVINWNNDTTLTRRGAANLRLGAADAAAPVAQTLSVQSGVTGASATTVSISGTALTIAGTVTGTIAIGHAVTGTGVTASTLITAGSGTSWTVNNSQTVGPITAYFNSVGRDFTITGNQASGPSVGGSIVFQVAPAGAAATTAQNALATALTIGSDRSITINGGTSAVINGPNAGPFIQSASNVWEVCNTNSSFPAIRLASGAGCHIASDLYFGFNSATYFTSGTVDTRLYRDAAGILGVRGTSTSVGAALSLIEQTAPAAPAANGVRIYAVDNGSGKTQLMALFATGAAQQIAIEP
jgi:hypothetical protein